MMGRKHPQRLNLITHSRRETWACLLLRVSLFLGFCLTTILFSWSLPLLAPASLGRANQAKNPKYTELSDRAILDWAEKSGIPFQKNVSSNDKPDAKFGIPEMEAADGRWPWLLVCFCGPLKAGRVEKRVLRKCFFPPLLFLWWRRRDFPPPVLFVVCFWLQMVVSSRFIDLHLI